MNKVEYLELLKLSKDFSLFYDFKQEIFPIYKKITYDKGWKILMELFDKKYK